MKFTLTLLTLISFSCGHEPSVNKDLLASFQRYLAAAPNDGHIDELVSVDWGEPPGTALGQCLSTPDWHGGHTRKIRIRRRGDPQIIVDALVAHELAHCLHDKIHDDTHYPMLMNSVLLEGQEAFWQENLDAEIRRALNQ